MTSKAENNEQQRMTAPTKLQLAALRTYYQTSGGYRVHLHAKGPGYFERFVAVVCAHSSSSDLVLDLGCGTGESTRGIAQAGRVVIGTDLSPLFLESQEGQKSQNPRFIASDGACLPFADRCIDVVCSMEMIEHVWPVEKVLDEIDRVLKPGGRIVITSPNLISPLWVLRDFPAMVIRKRFRPPMYNSYATAFRYAATSLKLSVGKILSRNPQFLPQIPDLEHADYGGDFDAVYKSNVRDLVTYFERLGYTTKLAGAPETSLKRKCRTMVALFLGSLWTSYMLVATKPTSAN